MNEPRISVGLRRHQRGKPPLFAICQLLLLWVASPAAAQEGKQTSLKQISLKQTSLKQTSLKIGLQNSPPYHFPDTAGFSAGPAVALMQAAAAREGVRLERVRAPREALTVLAFHRALAYQVILLAALCALTGTIAAMVWLVRRLSEVRRQAEPVGRAKSDLLANMVHESRRGLAALAAQVEQHAGRAPDHSPLRVLVADDNAANRQAAVRMLESLGVRADVSANGREAVDMLRLLPYDLILMDCRMPLMNGQEAAIEIRKREPPDHRTPIVAMTAETGADRLDECLASGMDDILLKPVRREKLMATLHRWLPGGPERRLPVGDATRSRA
jgi:CheY-like chemotaxis protein